VTIGSGRRGFIKGSVVAGTAAAFGTVKLASAGALEAAVDVFTGPITEVDRAAGTLTVATPLGTRSFTVDQDTLLSRGALRADLGSYAIGDEVLVAVAPDDHGAARSVRVGLRQQVGMIEVRPGGSILVGDEHMLADDEIVIVGDQAIGPSIRSDSRAPMVRRLDLLNGGAGVAGLRHGTVQYWSDPRTGRRVVSAIRWS